MLGLGYVFGRSLTVAIMSAMSQSGSLETWLCGFIRFRCGWRGYLLLRLLENGGEARVSLIIGIVWALWHLPIMAMFADWRDGIPFLAYLPRYMAGVIGLSFVMSRVWLIGGRSLIPCIWLHGLVNAVGGIAFNHSVWTSRWSAEAGTGHFAIASALTAAFLLWTAHRRRQS